MASKEVAMTSRPMVSELFSSVIYKPNQGRMVRQVTALTIWVVAVMGSVAVSCHSPGAVFPGRRLVDWVSGRLLGRGRDWWARHVDRLPLGELAAIC